MSTGAIQRDDVAWKPSPEYVENANVTRLMRAHGIDGIDELRARSIADIGWYWNAVVEDLSIPFITPFQKVFDDSNGIKWTRWFTGGLINMTAVCVDRWANDPEVADREAIICQRETGDVETLTYA